MEGWRGGVWPKHTVVKNKQKSLRRRGETGSSLRAVLTGKRKSKTPAQRDQHPPHVVGRHQISGLENFMRSLDRTTSYLVR